MGFKLIRLDAEEPDKIPLSVGTHVIGRGSFLNCDDHRVSRQHGVIKVTDDTVVLKSLHQNPCFYNKLNLHKTIVLPQGKWVSLINTDHFGLLPDTYWYELIFCNDNTYSTNTEEQENIINTSGKALGTHTHYKDRSILTTEVNKATRSNNNEVNLDTQPYSTNTEYDENSDSESLNLEFDKTMEDCTKPESQSLLTAENTVPGDPITTPPLNDQTNSNKTVCGTQTTPGKRSHSSEPSPDAKKIKVEPESPKNTESHKDPAAKEPKTTKEANTEPHGPTRPLSSMETDTEPKEEACPNHEPTEPQSPGDVQTDSQSSMDAITYAESATDANIEPQSPSNADNVKQEPPSPNDVKKQPDLNKPGPSHDQQGSSNDDGSAAAKTPPAARERCIYGANCYRKNPQHKLQFSHPSDADYGAGPRGQCPYGAACRRTDPRHWTLHQHPPGTTRPAPRPHPQGMRVVQRHGQIFYINAHAVHFHDDHYEVEDEDGDSVDFDYEF